MEFINEIVEFVKNISVETIINILIALIIIIIFNLFSSLFSYMIIKLFNMKKNKNKIKKNMFYKPIKIFFSILGIYIGILILKLPTDIMDIINKTFKICVICLIANGFVNIVNSKSEFSIKLKSKLKINGDDTIANFISKIIKAIIYVVTGFIIASEFGYDLNGLIAGLGLGGVVIAFAAQDIAKNLFGGVAIIIDKPFVVGDWIETKICTGSVEDISFRSTKVRTSDDSVITIPNSVLSNEAIINWNRINKRRYAFNLAFGMNTKIERIKDISDKILFILQNNTNVDKESIEIHIDAIKQDSVNLFISIYTDITAYFDYLVVKETINCSIMELLQKEETVLTYPTQNINIKNN